MSNKDKLTYTKPIPLENLPYTPKEIGELRQKFKNNKNKTSEINVNIKGLGSGKLIMSRHYGTRFFPDSNKAFHQLKMRQLNAAQLGFNAPMMLAPFIGLGKGLHKIGNQKGWFSGKGNTRPYPFGNEGNVVNLTKADNQPVSNNLKRLGSNVTGTLSGPNDKAVRFTPAELQAMGINQPMASTLKINTDQPMDVAAYDKGMQRQLSKIKPTSDHYWSLASTPPAQFRIGGKTIAFKKKDYMEKGKQQHHFVQKAVSGRVLQRIRALMNNPSNKLKASAKDLEEIHALPMKYGLEAGSGVGALFNMDTKPHLVLHGEHRRGITEDGGYQPGLEPSGRHLEELYKEIETANPKQLKKIYEEFLKEVSIPLKREAELYQDAYDKLKIGKMPTKQELTKLKKELGIKLEIIDEAKADEKERKLMNTIPEEMWYSKGR
tara:strand:+ start:49 stop:1350 length:1302 start_codon:yes stop_codon:yes gene_type:complete